MANYMKMKYPKVNCEALNTLVGDDMRQKAILEYNSNHVLEDLGEHVVYKGYLQCFCTDQKKLGFSKNELYSIIGDPTKVPVCAEYWPAKKKILVYTSVITGIVLVINEILKMITIWLVERVRYPTHSERLTKITNGVFIAQFFNTGFLITLVSANFTEVPFLSSLHLFEG
jgi:hypothetical protein